MSVSQPTFNWDFRQTVSSGGTVDDIISGNTATLVNACLLYTSPSPRD